MSAELQHSLAA